MDDRVLKALIVDDEPIARRVLCEDLEASPDVQVIGEAADGKEALQKIARLRPDLVFLDLQMPLLSGLEVVHNLTEPPLPVIVIVTAYEAHAIRAFEAGAIDYLLKPISEARLRKAVERAKAMIGRPAEIAAHAHRIASAIQPPPLGARRIVGRNGDEYHILESEDVLAFQAERELVWIVTAQRRLLATEPLRAIEERLGDRQFQRVHRNAVVNVNHIRKMTAISSQRWLITLSNSLQLVVSKRRAHVLREMLRWQ